MWHNGGSCTSAYVLLNLLNELGKMIRCKALPILLSIFLNKFMCLINSIIKGHECKIAYHMILNMILVVQIQDFCINKCDIDMDIIQ